MDINKLLQFVSPFYAGKDTVHNLWHIQLVCKSAERLLQLGISIADREIVLTAAYFHGCIDAYEKEIRNWLLEQGYTNEQVKNTVQAAKESQADANPQTPEGMLLHDAHLLEGGKAYMITKCLIAGSVRGQTLPDTIAYIEKHIINKRKCCLKESVPLFEEANRYTMAFLEELKKGIA